MSAPFVSVDTTVDAFLGGRVEAVQPASGYHRSGLEAVLLGAAMDPAFAGKVVDLGAGAGVAGFCAASRCQNLEVLLVEREQVLLDCARTALNLPANAGFAARVTIAQLDIEAPEETRATAGLRRESARLVLMNPPFHSAASVSRSPSNGRADAHVLSGGFDPWFRVAAHTLEPRGEVVAVAPASAIAEIITSLGGRFGAVRMLPIHPRSGRPAELLLVQAVKGSRAKPILLPGLVLHGGSGNAYTAEMDRLLRSGAGLADVHPSWR